MEGIMVQRAERTSCDAVRAQDDPCLVGSSSFNLETSSIITNPKTLRRLQPPR